MHFKKGLCCFVACLIMGGFLAVPAFVGKSAVGKTGGDREKSDGCMSGTWPRPILETGFHPEMTSFPDSPDEKPAFSSMPCAVTGVSAEAAVLMEASTGEWVFRHRANKRLPMASTTKIMTALVALEALPLTFPVRIPKEAVGVEGSSVYLKEGETLTLEQLLYAVLLSSANDASVAVACAVSGNTEAFAERMNRKARSMGLTDTHFVNPHGLDDPDHYTTAEELAKIARAALENPTFRTICSAKRFSIPLNGKPGGRLLLNHNRMLGLYEGSFGVKTGYTRRTGRCLVSAAEREGVTLIAVTLNDPDDWRDHRMLLDYGFSLYETVNLCEPSFYASPLPTVNGVQEYVMVRNTEALFVTIRRNHGPVTCLVELPHFIFAPVRQGETVGHLVFIENMSDGHRRMLGKVPLYAAYGVENLVYKRSFSDWLAALFP